MTHHFHTLMSTPDGNPAANAANNQTEWQKYYMENLTFSVCFGGFFYYKHDFLKSKNKDIYIFLFNCISKVKSNTCSKVKKVIILQEKH